MLATCECSEEAKELPSDVWAKVGIGQQRQPLKECVAKRQRCAASELEQTPSSAASAVSRRHRGFTLRHSLAPMFRPPLSVAVTERKEVPPTNGASQCSERASPRPIRSAARLIMRVHRQVGKKAMIVTLLLVVENGARRLCQKHFVQGRYRTTAQAVERVCCKASAVCSIGVGADTVERSECGVAET